MLQIRLCDDDRALYGCDESLPLDMEAVKDLAADELTEIDQALQMPFSAFLEPLENPLIRVAQVQRVAVWLALRMAGTPVDWEKCTPKLLRAEFVWEAPSGPPAGASERSSEGAPAGNS